MSSISFDYSTKFTANEVIQLVDECLTGGCKVKYNITEETNDEIMKKWSIEFFMFSSIIQYDTWNKLPKNKVKVIFKEGKVGEPNLVVFKDFSTTKSLFCKDKILTLKSFIAEKEK